MYIPFFMSYNHPFITRTTSKHDMISCWYQKMSVPAFGSFIKLMSYRVQGHGSHRGTEGRTGSFVVDWHM